MTDIADKFNDNEATARFEGEDDLQQFVRGIKSPSSNPTVQEISSNSLKWLPFPIRSMLEFAVDVAQLKSFLDDLAKEAVDVTHTQAVDRCDQWTTLITAVEGHCKHAEFEFNGSLNNFVDAAKTQFGKNGAAPLLFALVQERTHDLPSLNKIVSLMEKVHADVPSCFHNERWTSDMDLVQEEIKCLTEACQQKLSDEDTALQSLLAHHILKVKAIVPTWPLDIGNDPSLENLKATLSTIETPTLGSAFKELQDAKTKFQQLPAEKQALFKPQVVEELDSVPKMAKLLLACCSGMVVAFVQFDKPLPFAIVTVTLCHCIGFQFSHDSHDC